MLSIFGEEMYYEEVLDLFGEEMYYEEVLCNSFKIWPCEILPR